MVDQSVKITPRRMDNKVTAKLNWMIIFRIGITLIALICFALHVQDSLTKFSTAATTLTSSQIKVSEIHLPAITFCTRDSYNTTSVQKLGIKFEFWNIFTVSEHNWKNFSSKYEENT